MHTNISVLPVFWESRDCNETISWLRKKGYSTTISVCMGIFRLLSHKSCPQGQIYRLLSSSSATLHLTLLSFATLFPTFARSYSRTMERFWMQVCGRGVLKELMSDGEEDSQMSQTSFQKLWWKFSFPNGLFTFPKNAAKTRRVSGYPTWLYWKMLNLETGLTGKIQPGYAVDMACIKLGRLLWNNRGVLACS